MAVTPGCFMSVPRVNSTATAQQGVALVTALLIVAVIVVVISRQSFSTRIWLRQVENTAMAVHAGQAARAAELWMIPLLEQDSNDYDAGTEFWAQTLPAIPLDLGTLSARIEDLQGRFNLNNLVDNKGRQDPGALEQFTRLLLILELDPEIATAVADWVDSDRIQNRAGGSEDSSYQGLERSYLPANQPLQSEAELRLVRGVDRSVWERLKPHVTALPQLTGLNVNTATAEVLAAVMTGWGPVRQALPRARRWAGEIARKPFQTASAFAERGFVDEEDGIPAGLGVGSRYFRSTIHLQFEQVIHRVSAVYYRDGGRAVLLYHQREFI